MVRRTRSLRRGSLLHHRNGGRPPSIRGLHNERRRVPDQFRQEVSNLMSEDDITRTNAEAATWTRFDALSERERDAAALRDPDAQPLTPDDMLRMRRTPQVKINRRALGLSQDARPDRLRCRRPCRRGLADRRRSDRLARAARTIKRRPCLTASDAPAPPLQLARQREELALLAPRRAG